MTLDPYIVVYHNIGRWITLKFQAQARSKGVFQAAMNMKKQGYPLSLALQVLARDWHVVGVEE